MVTERRIFMAAAKIMRVNRWGNGFGIRLPKEFVDRVKINETSRVEVSADDDRLIITCVKEPRRHIPLAERLKDWEGEPCEPEEIDWGAPVGDEIW